MKKQHKTYLLLALVFLIWGMIGYKFVNGISPSVETPQVIKSTEKFVPQRIKKRESFNIVANYRDPFLGTIKKHSQSRKAATKSVKKEVPKKSISYTGFITDTGSNQKIFFVTVEGQQHMMTINESFKEVKLIKGTKNYIEVSYYGISDKILIAQ